MVAATRQWRLTPARAAAIERMRLARAERVRQRHEAQEREGGTCTVLLAGVDTLNLSSKATLAPALLKELLELKACALRNDQEGAALPRWRSTALNLELEVQPHGNKKGDLQLNSKALVLTLHSRSPKNLPRAYVELKAEFLWTGWEKASDAAVELLREVAEEPHRVDAQVSRIDVCVDFMGWQPPEGMLDQVIGRVVRRDKNFEPVHRKEGEDSWYRQHGRGRRFTGFTFGGGQLLARMYDKTVEMKVHGKTWFEEKWKARGYVDEATSGHVWRLEFQIRREPIRNAELVTAAMKDPRVDGPGSTSVKSWADLRCGLNELWRYLTTKWLTYRLPRTGKERVRLHPKWRALMAARFVELPDGEFIRHSRLWSMNRYLAALAGYMKREMPHEWKEAGHAPNEHRFDVDLVAMVKKTVELYEHKHGETLFEAARNRWREDRELERLYTTPKRAKVRNP